MKLPEKCFEWQAGAWAFGITLVSWHLAHQYLVG